ncbi:hypothetical protein BGZ80_006963 [Entomortierella chlamydospora]|uniref:G domain-containing protein n=1 Tax=Entomortierella chlamydospora TaxID=101097 RepID=A0A9P6T1X4_9FUNG|nr:hypothetical protein BGZ80_006963 [Entomortierella chlamydospora]
MREELVKKYADPDYTIDLSNIGSSVKSCTKDIVRSTVHTDLPISKVVKNDPESSPITINLGSLISDSPNVDDFDDVLNQRNIAIVQAPSKSSKQYQFNLIDTPGLNDTRGKDEKHIASIYKASRYAECIHLVLLAIGNGPFSPGFQAAIKCYFDMFPEFHGIVAFVHTHFDYKNFHPGREEAFSHHIVKKGTLNDMMRRDTCHHLEIDCDVKSTRPIRIGITQNIIRRILSLAPFNQPVTMKRVLILKSPKMRVIDNILVDKLKAILDAQRKAVDFKDGAQGAVLRKLYEMETHLNSLRSEEYELEEYIKEHDTDDLVMIYESRFDESWRALHLKKDHCMDFQNQEHIIRKKDILRENVEISKEQGGEGHNYWNIVYKRHRYEDGSLHVKLYTTRSSIYSKQISERRSRLAQLRSDRQEIEREHSQYSSNHQSEQADIRKLVELNALYTGLISRLSRERLPSEVFQQLIDANAYASENSEIVEKVYRGIKFQETVKKYADPNYVINPNNIGGSVSCTKNVIHSTVHTSLPIAKTIQDSSGSTTINLGSLINNSPDVDDFEDVLDKKDIKTDLVPSPGSPEQYQFNLIDTPGLNDTRGRDEEHIGSIYKALREAGYIHLVLITTRKSAFTPSFRAAIKYYFDMFPEFHGTVAFVHTHFDYKDLHPKRDTVFSDFTKKKDTLNEMMGETLARIFEIDCDIKSTKPVRIGITQNIIRKILSLAPFNQPVTMNRTLVLKSPRMKDIDNVLIDRYKAILDAQRATLDSKDGTYGNTLRKLYEMETRLNSLRSEERDLEEYVKEYDTDDLVMIYESKFDESWRFFQFNEDHRMEFPCQEHIINKKNVFSENVEISKEQGGEGHSYWSIVYKRHSYDDGILYAKLYTTRSSTYSNQISECKSRLVQLNSDLLKAEQERSQYSYERRPEMVDIRKLVEENILYTRLISRLLNERLSPEMFQQLIDAKAYTRSSPDNTKIVDRVYRDILQNDEAELLERPAV